LAAVAAARQRHSAHSATVAAARWLRRWRQRDIMTSAAAWQRRATGDDNEDDDDGDGDGAMGRGATGYDDDDDDDDGDGATTTTTTMATARRATGYDNDCKRHLVKSEKGRGWHGGWL
jgi:hypothetical protein